MKKTLLLISATLLGALTTFAAPFTAGNLVIYRVGDGSAALSANATAVFLDEYTTAGALVQSIPMPTAASGSNRQLTGSGTATSEGLLTRSSNGQYLILPGYDAAVGTASITTSNSTAVNRVIGRVSSNATIDTTTALTDVNAAASAGNPRSATSTNGTDLWMDGSVNGIRYTTLGATTSTQLSTTVTNLRATNIFGGQLYVSSSSGAFRLATVGTGTPTTNMQTITNLPGFPTATGSPYQFFFADLDPVTPGLDTVYVADDSAVASGGGIQKYSLVSGSWVANGVVALASTRGLTGVVNGTSVTLYVTANGTTMQTLTDASGYNATITGTLTSLATATTNTAFRGIAFAPASAAPPPVPTSAVSRKTHTGVGDFDIPLPLTPPVGIECRLGGATNDYQMVVTFPSSVTVTSTSVNSGTGSISSATGSGTNTITVNLTGVTDQQTITVGLNGVSDGVGTGNVAIPMGVLVGDTNGNGTVNAGDTTQTRGRSGQTADATNFRSDVNTSGVINSGDQIAVRSRAGNFLP